MGEEPKAAAGAKLGPMDFSTFVVSLGTSALVQLQPKEDGTPPGSEDIALGRQSIDILGMLVDKTAGNLTSDESKLLSGVLYQVRLAFVEAKDLTSRNT